MAQINHVSGKSYRVCVDADNDVYDELSFIEDASDVKFTDGTDVETSLGSIKGITSDVSGEAEDIAASIKVVNQLNNSLAKVKTYVGEDGKLHFVDSEGADSVLPFSSKPTYAYCYTEQASESFAIDGYSQVRIKLVGGVRAGTYNQSYLIVTPSWGSPIYHGNINVGEEYILTNLPSSGSFTIGTGTGGTFYGVYEIELS